MENLDVSIYSWGQTYSARVYAMAGGTDLYDRQLPLVPALDGFLPEVFREISSSERKLAILPRVYHVTVFSRNFVK